MDTDALRKQLLRQGTKRRRLKRLRAEAAADLAELVPAAHAAGIPIAEISRLADLSRPAVYTILEQTKR